MASTTRTNATGIAPTGERCRDSGATFITLVVATAVVLVLLTGIIQVITFQYGKGTVRAALDEAARSGARAPSSIAICQERASNVLSDLLGGSMGDGVRVACTDAGDRILIATSAGYDVADCNTLGFETVQEARRAAIVADYALTAGEEATFIKRTAVATSRDRHGRDPSGELTLVSDVSWEALLAEHAAVWHERWANCDVIIEGEYRTAHQEQLYIETNGVIAVPETDGIAVYGSMQCPYYVHRALTVALGMPGERVRVVPSADSEVAHGSEANACGSGARSPTPSVASGGVRCKRPHGPRRTWTATSPAAAAGRTSLSTRSPT